MIKIEIIAEDDGKMKIMHPENLTLTTQILSKATSIVANKMLAESMQKKILVASGEGSHKLRA